MQVKNRGPDQVPLTEIVIQWPYEAPSGKHLLYLIKVVVRGYFNSTKGKSRYKGWDPSLAFAVKLANKQWRTTAGWLDAISNN